MANGIETIAYELGDPIAAAQGVAIVDAAYKKEAGSWYLRIYIDKAGGVGLEDCERFSRALEAALDEKDPIREPYCLEVSSPGLGRELKKERELLHYTGSRVEVKLYKAIAGVKELDGILEGYQNGIAAVRADGTLYEFDKREAVYIRLYVAF